MLSLNAQVKILNYARKNPTWFAENVLGDELWEAQKEVIQAVMKNKECAVASCHGAGKSFLGSRLALTFLCLYQPSLVITTAPTQRQVHGILWKEIKTAHAKAKSPIGGRLLNQELQFSPNHFAIGFTAPEYDPDRFQGWHEENILIIVDEAVGVSENIFTAIDGMLTSDNAHLLMIGNPTDASGRFGEAFRGKGKIWKKSISAFDTPNFTEFGITINDVKTDAWKEKIGGNPLPRPYLVTPEWVAERYKRWGETSPLFQSRVLGKFPEQSTDSLIPISWILNAVERNLDEGEPAEIGADIARYGPDETVFFLRRGGKARMLQVIPKSDTMETSGHLIRNFNQTGAEVIKVDADGLGAGVYDRLKELGKPVIELRSGKASSDNERFANARAEWWWGLRERFESGDIDIEEDDELISQLSSIKYKINSRGQMVVESKEDMKRRGFSSPDRADALMYAFAKDLTPPPLKIRARGARRR